MDIPFTNRQFMDVMATYNQSVWPAQIALLLMAVGVLYFTYFHSDKSGRIITFILAFLWAWVGVMYHWLHFTTINNAAWVFGGLFVLQALLFLLYGRLWPATFSFSNRIISWTGTVFIAYALVFYPILSSAFGHIYPESPTFGLPCPTTIFTFGILLQSQRTVPWWLWTIPLIWAIIGFSAAVNLHMYEDLGLTVAGLLGSYLLWRNSQRRPV